MTTLIIVLVIIALTCWIKRKEWFSFTPRQVTASVIKTNNEEPNKKPSTPIKWGALLMKTAGFILMLGMGSCLLSNSYALYKVIKNPKPQASAPPAPQQSSVVYGITPANITADYEFNIEADGPILVQYPGEKPLLFTPGIGFIQMPQPKRSGPKVFTDPKDPLNGHVGFRLYPVRGKF